MIFSTRLSLYATLMVTATMVTGISAAARALVDTEITPYLQTEIDPSLSVPDRASTPLVENNGVQVSQQTFSQELDAFWNSDYTFWDATVLAMYWRQTLEDSKAQIGRKILFGPADVSILEQMLLDAQLDAVYNAESLTLYSQSDYSYEDAAILADFWGDPTPYDAKIRIERNLATNGGSLVQEALRLASP